MDSKQAAKLISDNLNNIYGYAFGRLYDKDDVDDLTAEIVCEVLESASRINNDEAFWGFLWKVAENTFHKYLRQKERHARILPLTEQEPSCSVDPSLEEQLLDQEAYEESRMHLRRELSLLSKTNREVCLAYYFRNKSCKEIAAEQNLSLEMVKYHLFKTRQLLKEGIGMERTFGKKSYQPARFEFHTVFPGQLHREYMELFRRRLPGNILHSAYYAPMTIRELSLELGVSTVYMEDEVALLEKYKLLTALPGGKYQTNLIIFSSSYMTELFANTRALCTERMAVILGDMRSLLPTIRSARFCGSDARENRLLWPLLWLIMLQAQKAFGSDLPKNEPSEVDTITMGLHFGTDFEKPIHEEYDCGLFAGFAGLSEGRALSFVDFGVLPETCCYAGNEAAVEQAVLSGSKDYLFFTKTELETVKEMLRAPTCEMTALYRELCEAATALMKQHAPRCAVPLVNAVIGKTLFFQTIGFIGRCAVASGLLSVPDDGKPIALFSFETSTDELRKMESE